jgi:UDP-N-acetylglucosamine--N-acetylmuramyl-(pentapeptide) pyrophosphoryl-undecaprenol N-acetylglucosamine transferase
LARDRGHEVLYFGSIRGQEKAVCDREDFPFRGFPSEPVYSLKKLKSWKAVFHIWRARRLAIPALRAAEADALFSTGGYSAGPVVSAAMKLGLPYVMHAADAIPARSISLFAKRAFAVTTVFKSAAARLDGVRVERTGMPIRRELREAAELPQIREGNTVLVTGGSQGAAFLNSQTPKAARLMGRQDLQWIHAAGQGHAESVMRCAQGIPGYQVSPFLAGDEMAQAYRKADVVLCRSGGSLAEVAMFGIPSVLVPFPTAANDHQTANAQEFVAMGAAILHTQATSTPETLARDLLAWIDNPAKRSAAAGVLAKFDIPNAADRIMALVEEAAR